MSGSQIKKTRLERASSYLAYKKACWTSETWVTTFRNDKFNSKNLDQLSVINELSNASSNLLSNLMR